MQALNENGSLDPSQAISILTEDHPEVPSGPTWLEADTELRRQPR